MEVNIIGCSYEGKWFDFGNAKLKIRPCPASRQNFGVKDGVVVFLGADSFDKFKYALEAWEGYVTVGDHKPIELTDEVKKKVFDFRLGATEIDGEKFVIADFVLRKADELVTQVVADEKN